MINFLYTIFSSGMGARPALPQDRVTSLFQSHFAEFYARFNLPKSFERMIERKNPGPSLAQRYYNHYANIPQAEAPNLEAWEAVTGASVQLTSFIPEALRLGMNEQVNALLNVIRQVAETYDQKYFKHFFLPFLRSFVPVYIEQKQSISTMDSFNIYQWVLSSYSRRYVGQKPPPQTSWARTPTSCSCRDCVALNHFIISPIEHVGRFAVNKSRRQHLHQILDELGKVAYIHETERYGRPQTLVVTKMQTLLEQKRQAWYMRRTEAIKEFNTFGLTTLRDILGDRFAEITGMDDMSESVRHGKRRKMDGGTETGHNRCQSLASSSHAQNVGVPMTETGSAGTKRKIRIHEIIDLTGE
jgi:hypothetical protein